jgi:hypothetical protein
MNFNDEAKFFCDYTVFDATGKVLGQAKDVAIPAFEYIKSINFSCTNADKALLLDDYTITLTGSAADFELYDAKTGMIVTDLSAPRDRDTAYRFSWLNATAETRSATIVASIYESGTLKEERVMKEVTMKPGYDGVETGIVELAQGQTVIVSLKDPNATPENPTTAPTTPAEKTPAKGMNPMVYVVIGAVILGALLIAAALWFTKPKKTNA